MTKPQVPLGQVHGWLQDLVGREVTQPVALEGGYWSSAYAFNTPDDAWVLRLAADGEAFRIDQEAHQRFADYLPIPEVTHLGRAFDLHYAISRRCFGQMMETVDLRHAPQAILALSDLLVSMRQVPTGTNTATVWYDAAATTGWQTYLQRHLDMPAGTAASAEVEDVLAMGGETFLTLLPACPERRDLIHADLFHQNVLLGEQADTVTGIFSWKCSALGDFLYDVAWSVFWGRWYVAFADEHLAQRLLQAADLTPAHMQGWQHRLCCYQLQIALSHVHWYLQTGDQDWLERMLSRVRELIGQARRL